MTIRFKCLHCKKSLSVKDEFSGRKGSCPACKKGLTVPAPASTAVDVEALAAAAFTDQPASKPAARSQATIDFPCPHCDYAIQAAAELSGRQTQCPDCRRIVKVPQLVKDEPVDWRKNNARGPSGARRDTEPAPEGTWSTAATTRASTEALVEAGAIVEEREPWTLKQKVGWGTAAVAALGLIVAAFWIGAILRAKARQDRAITSALDAVAAEGKKPKLGPERDAAIHLAAGEFVLNQGKREGVHKAKDHFANARSFLVSANSRDRDLLLAELALAQLELGGEGDDVDKGRRLKWDVAANEIGLTLEGIVAPETRIEALRTVSRQLIARGQDKYLPSLAQKVGKNVLASEALAVVALELHDTGKSSQVESLAELAASAYREPPPPPMVDKTAQDPLQFDIGGKDARQREAEKANRPPPSPALVALCLTLNKPNLLKDFAEKDPTWTVGQAEALARRGNPAGARGLAQNILLPLLRLQALTAIAAVAAQKDPASAAADVEAAATLVESDLRGDVPPGLLLRLIRLGLRADLAGRMEKVAGAVKDPDLRGWAQLELLRANLSGKKSTAEDSLADTVEKKRLAHALALGSLARHNARYEGRAPAAIDTWDEGLRPFGHAGAALGLQDRGR